MAATEHPSFVQPVNLDVKIWRYMDLPKFVWLLQRRALFFARADKLGDPYEGYYTRVLAQSEAEFVAQMRHSHNAATPFNEDVVRSTFSTLRRYVGESRTSFFVNSWHMNDADSAAMWRLYTTLGHGICVTSTYRNLFNLLPTEATLGQLKYINYDLDYIDMTNVFNYITHKRISYEHEKEVRAVIWSPTQEPKTKFSIINDGFVVPVELGDLIREVYVSPYSFPPLREVVSGLLRTYDVIVPTLESEVNAPPSF